MLGTIAEQAGEMSYIVEDLLVAARTEEESVSVRSEPVDMVATVQSVVRSLGMTHRVTVANRTRVSALGDNVRLRQVLRNLFTNADRYGGTRIEVDIDLRGRSMVVHVRDDGDGVEADLWEEIFDPYVSLGIAFGRPGSLGLGLTVSRRLARRMGGDLTSRRHAGWSVFELSLPVAVLTDAEQPGLGGRARLRSRPCGSGPAERGSGCVAWRPCGPIRREERRSDDRRRGHTSRPRAARYFIAQQNPWSRAVLVAGTAIIVAFMIGLLWVVSAHGWTQDCPEGATAAECAPTDPLTEGLLSDELGLVAWLTIAAGIIVGLAGFATYKRMPNRSAREAVYRRRGDRPSERGHGIRPHLVPGKRRRPLCPQFPRLRPHRPVRRAARLDPHGQHRVAFRLDGWLRGRCRRRDLGGGHGATAGYPPRRPSVDQDHSDRVRNGCGDHLVQPAGHDLRHPQLRASRLEHAPSLAIRSDSGLRPRPAPRGVHDVQASGRTSTGQACTSTSSGEHRSSGRSPLPASAWWPAYD